MGRWHWKVWALVEVLGTLRRELGRLRRERDRLREQLRAVDAENERLRRESDDDASRIGIRDNDIERLELALADAERERDVLRASRSVPSDSEDSKLAEPN